MFKPTAYLRISAQDARKLDRDTFKIMRVTYDLQRTALFDGYMATKGLSETELMAAEDLVRKAGVTEVHIHRLIEEAVLSNTDAWCLTVAPEAADYEHSYYIADKSVLFGDRLISVRLVFSRDRSRAQNYQFPRYQSFLGFTRELTRDQAELVLNKQAALTLDDLGVR